MGTPKVCAMVCAGLLAATAAQAQAQSTDTGSGLQAGSIMVRLRAIGVIPQNFDSSVSAIGGHVSTTNQAGPEVDLSYFFTDNIAVEGIAASTRHELSATGSSLGNVDVGSTYVLPPTVTAQYHFLPHNKFNPYLGIGATVAFFYDTHPAGPTVTKLGLSTAAGLALQAGVDYHVTGPWYLNFDVKQVLFLNTEARLNGGAIVAKTGLDPTIIGFGVGYRF